MTERILSGGFVKGSSRFCGAVTLSVFSLHFPQYLSNHALEDPLEVHLMSMQLLLGVHWKEGAVQVEGGPGIWTCPT